MLYEKSMPLHGKAVSQTHPEKETLISKFFTFTQQRYTSLHFATNPLTTEESLGVWQPGVSDSTPGLIMKGFAYMCSLFCGKRTWLDAKAVKNWFCCEVLFVCLFLISREICRLCILLLHSSASCSHGNSGWELTVMLFTEHSSLLVVVCGTAVL